jgi:hypothetical protein
MKFEIDPDVWLFSRLTFGRGARAIANLAVALAFLVVGLAGVGRDTAAWSGLSDVLHVDLLLGGALILCILAPVAALTQLINLERQGLLDVIRLCGRSPLRLLLTASAGSMWANVVVSASLLVSYLWRFTDPNAALLALLALAAALTVAWFAYGCPPGIATTTSQSFSVPVLLKAIAPVVILPGYFQVLRADWVHRLVFDDPRALATFAIVGAALPAAAWIAARQLRRQPSSVVRQRRPRRFARLAWGAAGIGPPEMIRQVRRFGSPLILLAAALAMGVVVLRATVRAPVPPLGFLPYIVVTLGALLIEATVFQEFQSGTIDLIRLTPQSPAAVVVGWYAGIALPFGAVAVFLALSLQFAARGARLVPAVSLPIVAGVAALMPALAIVDGFLQRTPGTYLLLYPMLGFLALVTAEYGHNPLVTPMATTSWRWPLGALLAMAAVIPTLSLAIGRFGWPKATGVGRAAGVTVAAAVCVWVVFPQVFPRLVVALLVLCATSVADDRAASARWLASVAGIAFASVVGLAWTSGLSAGASLITGVGASMAFIIGRLTSSLSPALALRLPLILIFVVLLPPWHVMRFSGSMNARTGVSPLLQTGDLILLAVAFGGAWLAHAHRRARAVDVVAA